MPETATTKTGWTTVAFGDVVRQVKDKVDPEESGLERYVAGEHMDTDDLRIRRWGIIGDGYLGPAFHMRFKPGHVLYGSRRTYLRKVALADFEGITANTTYVLESKDPAVLLPELLPFIMQTESFHTHSKRESKGSVNPYVNFSDLAWHEFALPPLEEQRRIAEVLNSIQQLSERLTNVKLNAATQLEAQREAAFNNARTKETPMGAIAKVRYGLGQPPAAAQEGVAMIRATNINRGRISSEGMMRIDLNDVPMSRRLPLDEGDILLVRSGAYTGDSALVTKVWSGSIAGYDLIISPNRKHVIPSYLAQFLLSKRTVVRKLRPLSARTAQPHLNTADVSGVMVPCPDLAAQKEAVSPMERTQQSVEAIEIRLGELTHLKSCFLDKALGGGS